MKSKTTAAVLALFAGGLGVHKFYLDRPGQGVLYLLFCWTFIPAFVAFFEAVGFLMMSEQAFQARYGGGLAAPPAQGPVQQSAQSQNIVVHVAGTGSNVVDLTTQLRALHELKLSGALSEEEYAAQKSKILAAK